MSPEVIIYRQYDDMKENYKRNTKPHTELSIIKKLIFLNVSSCFLVHFMIHQLHGIKSKRRRRRRKRRKENKEKKGKGEREGGEGEGRGAEGEGEGAGGGGEGAGGGGEGEGE